MIQGVAKCHQVHSLAHRDNSGYAALIISTFRLNIPVAFLLNVFGLKDRTWLFVIILISIATRGTVIAIQFENFQLDPDAYKAIAKTIAIDGTFGLQSADHDHLASPTAFRPPLYPYLLSWLTTVKNADQSSLMLSHFAIAIFHCLLGVVTALCTLSICRRLIDGGRIGFRSVFATFLVIVDPILLRQSSFVMTETLATAIASLVLWCWVSRLRPKPTLANAVLLGSLLSLAYLCRPTFLVWGVLMLPMIAIALPTCRYKRVAFALITAGLLFSSVAGWSLRNMVAIGHPVWATTHGGYTLLLANNPMFYDYLRNGSFGEAWDATAFLKAHHHRFHGDPTTESFWDIDWSDKNTRRTPMSTATFGEYEDDRLCYNAAVATIKRQPGMFVWSCVVRVARLWSPMPHHVAGRSWSWILMISSYYLLLGVGMLIGMYRLGRSLIHPAWWATAALVIALSAVHAVYWSNLRMRAPAIPGLVAIVAVGAIRPKHLLRRPSIEPGNDQATHGCRA